MKYAQNTKKDRFGMNPMSGRKVGLQLSGRKI